MKIKTLISLLVIFALALGAWAAEKQVDDTVVKGGALDIEVKDGVVTLKGKVELEQQKTKAEKLARKVSGVKQVDNQIVVVGKGNPR
jgi:hypothetical protein